MPFPCFGIHRASHHTRSPIPHTFKAANKVPNVQRTRTESDFFVTVIFASLGMGWSVFAPPATPLPARPVGCFLLRVGPVVLNVHLLQL